MKFKSLAAGFLAGMMVMTTFSVFALTMGNGTVEAHLQDRNVSIIADGKYIELPEGFHILNYDGRIYTPARLIGESLGAAVEWEDARRAVILTSPEVEAPVKETEKEPLKESTEDDSKLYGVLPLKREKDDFEIMVHKYDFSGEYLYITFDFKYEGGKIATLKSNDTYVEVDGEKYYLDSSSHTLNTSSIQPSELYEDVLFTFKEIPRGTKKVKLVIPIEYIDRNNQKVFTYFEFKILLDK